MCKSAQGTKFSHLIGYKMRTEIIAREIVAM